MALKDSISKLDRALDRGLEKLPDVSSKADRERYRGAVKSGVSRAGRRASVTLKNLDELGDRYAGKLRPKRGGWDRLIDWTTANPLLTLIITVVIAGLIGSQALLIPQYMHGEMEIYLPPDNEATKILKEMRVDYTSDVIVIFIKGMSNDGKPLNLTDYRVLQEMSRFEGDDTNMYAPDPMDRGIDPDKGDHGHEDSVVFVLSISSLVKEYNSTPGRLLAAGLGQVAPPGSYAIPQNQQRIDTLLSTVPLNILSGLVKDTNGDGIYDRAAILIGVKPGTPPSDIVGKVDRMLKHLQPKYSIMINTGPMTVIEKIQTRTILEFIKIMPFLVLYLFIAMYFFHRTLKAPLIGLIPCVLALLITYGIMGMLHDYVLITPLVALVAPCLLALGISYGIYIINRFTEEKKGTPVERARVAAKVMHPAILLSAAAMAIGFASLMVGTLPPIAVIGAALSGGIILTYLFTMLLTPSLTVLLKYRKRIEWGGWRKFRSVPSNHPKKIILFFVIVVIVSAIGLNYVKFNADYLAMAPTDDPSFTNMNEYSHTMNGGQMGMVLVRGNATHTDVLFGMDALESSMNMVPNTRCLGVVDVMKMVKAPPSFNVTIPIIGSVVTITPPVGASFWDAIKASSDRYYVQTYLINLFYSALSPEMKSFLVNEQFTSTLIYIFQPVMDITATREAVNGVNTAIDSHPVPTATVSHLTGIGAIELAVNDLLIEGQEISLAVCILLTFLVLLPIFRSWRLSLFTMIPCIVVIGLEPLVLVTLNIPLSIFTVMIGSIAIGTGVDFAIQITQRVRLTGLNLESVRDAVENLGISFVEATSVMVVGFMAVLLSPGFMVDWALGNPWHLVAGVPIDSVRQFVLMIQVLLGLNAVAAIFILPAVYTLWLRWREDEKRRREREGW